MPNWNIFCKYKKCHNSARKCIKKSALYSTKNVMIFSSWGKQPPWQGLFDTFLKHAVLTLLAIPLQSQAIFKLRTLQAKALPFSEQQFSGDNDGTNNTITLTFRLADACYKLLKDLSVFQNLQCKHFIKMSQEISRLEKFLWCEIISLLGEDLYN